MFTLVSIPMMERRVAATRSDYEEYRGRTPMLLMRLGRKAGAEDSSNEEQT